ncbi:endoplasmic reticulum vesicle transporter, partial [Jimgerdemannia flammicorona]
CVREGWSEKLKTQSNEGCNINGNLLVNKVRGNFHIAPGRSFQQSHMHVHDMQSYFAGAQEGAKFDFSHVIHHLRFGEAVSKTDMSNPLDNTSKTTDQRELEVGMMYQYFLKIVSTEFRFLNKPDIFTNQYSVTQHERVLNGGTMNGLPGLFFNFEISPMLIIYKESRTSFTSFLTGVCAIVGGIFTVAGMIDGFIYRAERTLKRKMEMGKAL